MLHFDPIEIHTLIIDILGTEFRVVKQNHVRKNYPFTGIPWTTGLGTCVMSQPYLLWFFTYFCGTISRLEAADFVAGTNSFLQGMCMIY